MQLRIKGRSRIFSQEEVAQMIVLFANEILGKRLAKNCTFKLQIKHRLLKKHGLYGDMTYDDERRLPREFVIRIDSKLNKKDFVTTLAHEMVHVKQYARGQLRDTDDDVKWMGKRYDTETTEYKDWPWELEASAVEDAMWDLWIKNNS